MEQKKLKKIKLICLDIDGTLTDGGLYYDSAGSEIKKFNVHDGAGILLAIKGGIEVIILTGRESTCVTRRAKELGIKQVYQKENEKGPFLRNYFAKHNLSGQEMAYMGDDLNDLPAMALCGLVGCPNDACEEVKQMADFVSPFKGGQGAVRPFIESILRAQGCWEEAVWKQFGYKL